MNVYKNVNIALAISISLSACQGEEKLQRLSINELTLLSQFDIEQQYLKDLKQQYADEEARLIALSETYFLNKIDNQIILVDKESIDSNRVCLSGTISNWGDENVKSLTLRYTVKHQVSRRIIDVFEEEVYNSETDWLQKASNLDVSLRYSDRLTNSLTKGQTSQAPLYVPIILFLTGNQKI